MILPWTSEVAIEWLIAMLQQHCSHALLYLFAASYVVRSSDHCTVFAVPGNLCGNAEITVPVCNAVSAHASRSVITKMVDGTFDVTVLSNTEDLFTECTLKDTDDRVQRST